ncbi:hypothetical protein PM082_011601 [Marasmius tenuissimus]|nr:hypothetical protein PM082_011601 [Marasmius tenuissimus]
MGSSVSKWGEGEVVGCTALRVHFSRPTCKWIVATCNIDFCIPSDGVTELMTFFDHNVPHAGRGLSFH